MNRSINASGSASRLHSDLPIPPGEYLAEVLSELAVERTRLAEQLSLSIVEVEALLTGGLPLTATIAAQLEEATTVPGNIWLGLEAEYLNTPELATKTHSEAENEWQPSN